VFSTRVGQRLDMIGEGRGGERLPWTSCSEGRLLRKRFIVRLGRWDDVLPYGIGLVMSASIDMLPKSKLLLSGRRGDAKVEPLELENSDSERLRLRRAILDWRDWIGMW
jgi:hypothetical protein